MFLSNIFKKECTHPHISPEIDSAYCPDCGKLIKNEWYITRCASCGVKMCAMSKNRQIVPQSHYCSNCGSAEYYVEKLDAINFIDIKFAVLIKNAIENVKTCPTSHCWQEKTIEQPKLLTQYLQYQQ